jgi:excinuclease ABC subunit A
MPNIITVTNASKNNLKNVSVSLPLPQYIAFVGMSGSGKSTLAVDVIFEAYFTKNETVSIPVKPALFRQKDSGYSQKISLFQYLSGSTSGKTQKISLTSFIDTLPPSVRFTHEQLKKIATQLDIDKVSINKSISEMSMAEYNKCRFIKLLLSSDAELFIVDEIGAGLSFAESILTANALKYIVSLGYSVIAIDHSLPIISASDFIVELGPLAGDNGGEIMFSGTTKKFKETKSWKNMLTACNQHITTKGCSGKKIKISDINFHSFSHMDVTIPLNGIVTICGRSACGKSSLLDIISRAYDKSSNAWKNKDGINGIVDGKNYIRRPHIIDQKPLGINVTSTPATYTKILDALRNIYTHLPSAVKAGLTSSDFSYNTNGKCGACKGRGYIETEVDDEKLFKPCPECHGRRYNAVIDAIKDNGYSIGELLMLSAGKLYSIYRNDTKKKIVAEKIGFINEVGLSYLTLGQPSGTLSGGESQRIKMTEELAKKLGDRSLYLLDTPSKGLHVEDMPCIMSVLKKLVSKNNSVILAENHPFFVNNSDWIIYLDEGAILYSGLPAEMPEKYKKNIGLETFL